MTITHQGSDTLKTPAKWVVGDLPMAVEAVRGGADRSAVEAVLGELSGRFGNRISTTNADRMAHGQDPTWHRGQPPDAVFFAQSADEVANAVKACARHRLPVIAYGTGTSLEGHISAVQGGLTIDLSQMNRIIEVHDEDLDCVVEAGVTHRALNQHLRDRGLFFPVDPGADASLGGMAATRASGTSAVRYGTMRDNVVSLTVVMADGSLIRTARRARKSASGYDLTRLLVGSEGTLGIITELTLRLHGIPEAVAAAVCPFATLGGACNAVIVTIQSGIPVARIELLDEMQIRATNIHSDLGLPELPTLFLEFHGSENSVAEQSERFGEIAADFGGGDFSWATRTEERNRLWRARHEAFLAVKALAPAREALSSDVCVPISRLAESVTAARADIDELNLIGAIVGHVGDGNFHAVLLVDIDSDDEKERVVDFLDRVAKRAIEMDGTCTGEHGIGRGKLKYLEAEHGPALEIMRTIKRTLDPDGIMNPGKLVAPV